jgi:hypothetical protein
MTRASSVSLLVIVLVLAAARSSATPAIRAVGASHVVAIYATRGTSNNCARVLPLKRVVAAPAVLKGAMQALLRGPTEAERARGYGGWFSIKTAGHLESVRILHGVAFIDFHNFAHDMPNASTSCGSALLLAQLDRTAEQFPTVKRTAYSFNGSLQAFYEWLQRKAPDVW